MEMKAEPQKEHEWLHKLVGEWTCEAEATMEPGKPPEKSSGIEFKSDDHRVLTSHTRGDDGTWQTFMTAHYRRRK